MTSKFENGPNLYPTTPEKGRIATVTDGFDLLAQVVRPMFAVTSALDTSNQGERFFSPVAVPGPEVGTTPAVVPEHTVDAIQQNSVSPDNTVEYWSRLSAELADEKNDNFAIA